MSTIPQIPDSRQAAPPGGLSAFPGAVPSLPPGTRLVLEIPDAAAPSGFRVETPALGAFVAALAPAVVAHVRAQREEKERRLAGPAQIEAEAGPAQIEAEAGPAQIEAEAGPAQIEAEAGPACARCGQPKTRIKGGRMMCRPCQSAVVAAGHRARVKAGA